MASTTASVVVTPANAAKLAGVTALGETVDLSKKSIAAVADLGKAPVKKLNLEGNFQLSRATGLDAQRKTLTWLNLSACGLVGQALCDVAPLSELVFLSVANNSGIKNFPAGALAGQTAKLKALLVNNTGLSSLKGVGHLAGLNTLIASHTAVGEVGSDVLKLSELTKLSLSHTKITSIPAVASALPHLAELRLNSTGMTAVPHGLPASSLRLLDLGNCPIATLGDLAPLASLPRVVNVNFKGCPVAALPGYEQHVRGLCPALMVLDGDRVSMPEKDEKRRVAAAVEEAKAEKKAAKAEAKAQGPAAAKSDARVQPAASSASSRGASKLAPDAKKRKRDDGASGEAAANSAPARAAVKPSNDSDAKASTTGRSSDEPAIARPSSATGAAAPRPSKPLKPIIGPVAPPTSVKVGPVQPASAVAGSAPADGADGEAKKLSKHAKKKLQRLELGLPDKPKPEQEVKAAPAAGTASASHPAAAAVEAPAEGGKQKRRRVAFADGEGEKKGAAPSEPVERPASKRVPVAGGGGGFLASEDLLQANAPRNREGTGAAAVSSATLWGLGDEAASAAPSSSTKRAVPDGDEPMVTFDRRKAATGKPGKKGEAPAGASAHAAAPSLATSAAAPAAAAVVLPAASTGAAVVSGWDD